MSKEYNYKERNFFRSAMIMKRLEELFKKKEKFLKTQGIGNFCDFLRKGMKIKHEDLPYLMTGFSSFKGYQQLALEHTFDPDWMQRDDLGRKIKHLRPEIQALKQIPIKTIEEYDDAQGRIAEKKVELAQVEDQFKALPHKNTIPPELYKAADDRILASQKFIKRPGPKSLRYEFTDHGYKVFDTASSLKDGFKGMQRRKGEITDEQLTRAWGQINTHLRNSPLRVYMDRVLGIRG